jgi:hypothetical protein
MRVPLLAAIAAICAACADGAPSAATAPDRPSFAIRGAAAQRVDRCTLSPTSLTLARGATAALTITCFDNRGRRLGNPNPASAQWAVTNSSVATVDQRGRVRAQAAGTTLLRMWHPERPVRDSITITVSGGASPAPAPAPPTRPPNSGPGTTPPPSPAPPPATGPQPVPPPTGTPAPSTGFPNQPGGMIIITDRQFDSKARNNNDRGSSGSDGWDGVEYRHGRFTIVQDQTAPNGDGLVGQMYFPANMRAGTGPGLAQIYFPRGLRQVYLSIWAKISSNWVGNQTSTNKMFFLGVAGGNNQFFFSAEGAGSNALQAQLRLQGLFDLRARITPNRTYATVQRGKWQRWEFVLTCNSGLLMSNGSIDMWIDGTHVTSVNDVNWTEIKHPTRPCDMNIFTWNPTYGGGGASPGVDQYLWFDRVYISGK